MVAVRPGLNLGPVDGYAGTVEDDGAASSHQFDFGSVDLDLVVADVDARACDGQGRRPGNVDVGCARDDHTSTFSMHRYLARCRSRVVTTSYIDAACPCLYR